MSEIRWVSKRAVLTIHEEQIKRHGGPSGVRDDALLESALGRPQNLQAYGSPDLAELAAAYAWGLARNHAFVDGNKRTSFVVCLTFLALNGADLISDHEEKIATWVSLGAGTLAEVDLANWLRTRLMKRSA